MPITRGATITTWFTSATVTSVSQAHTVNAGTTLLLLAISAEAFVNLTVEPYWNGTEAFTLIHASTSSGSSGDVRNYIYGLVNPTVKTANITYTLESNDNAHFTAVNYLGTTSSSVEDATNYINEKVNDSAATTVNIASGGTEGATLFAAAVFLGGDGDPATNGEGFEELADSATGTSTSADISFYVADKIGGAPSGIIVDWVGTASDECCGILIEILPLAGGTPYSVTLTESLGIAATVQKPAIFLKSISGIISLSDILIKIQKLFKSPTETIGLSDTLTKKSAFNKTSVETTSLNDNLEKSQGHKIKLHER